MTTIFDLDRARRLRNALDYQAALRARDPRACREVVARHRGESARLAGESVGPVRKRTLIAVTQGSAPDGDCA